MSETAEHDHAAAIASIRVEAPPEVAFRVFTEQIGSWWRRGTHYWNDAARGQRLEFEPGLGGRLLEVYEDGAFEIGRITRWEPGLRLGYTWREAGWPDGEHTTVDIRFTLDGDGTLVSVRHSGWDTVTGGLERTGGYRQGWGDLLDWYADAANAR